MRAGRVSASSFFQYDDAAAPPTDEVFLDRCDDAAWRSIVASCERRRFRAGEQVITAGDADRSLIIVLDGELHSRVGTGRKARTLTVSRPGAVVGELGFLDGLPRSLDVVAVSDGELLRLGFAEFEALAAAEPALGRLILADLGRIVAMRVRRLTDRLVGGG